MELSKNDQKIMNLQKKIEKEKEILNKSPRFSPITNCSLVIDEQRFNLNTLNLENSILLLVKIHSYIMSARDLNIEEPIMISGFSLEEWEKDLLAKINHIKSENKKKTLRNMENKLTELLSNETKTEMEIQSIANLLDL